MKISPESAVRALYAALEAGQHGEALRPLFTADATIVEHPNAVKPAGARPTLPEMLQGSTAGAQLVAQQRFGVRSLLTHGTLVVVRLRWTATIARDVGPFRAGQELVAHIAQFIETRDGRIQAIETFDCYESFASG